jgi:hypothetical protein
MRRELRRVVLKWRKGRLLQSDAQREASLIDERVFPSDAVTPLVMNNSYARVFKLLLA